MKFVECSIADTLDFYNGKAVKLDEAGEIDVFGSNGKIGFSKEFNHENAIILGRVGAYCGSVMLSTEKFWATDNTIVLKTKGLQSLRYWFYRLGHFPIRSFAGGAAQPLMTHGILRGINIKVHADTVVQEEIAEILSTYDDLIENNRRRMALLEESARLLYREWFVRLRFPGYEHTPIVDGVPQGWDTGTVSDFYETSSGGTPSRTINEYFTGDIPWVKTKELSNGFITETDEHITDKALKNSSAKLFPNRTVLIALYGATVGELGITALPAATNQACCAVLNKDPRGHYTHAYLFFRESKEVLVGLSAGAAQKNISQQIVRGVSMQMPTNTLMSMFIDIVSPMFEQMLSLQLTNQKLRTARDLLLPRLMSGELAV